MAPPSLVTALALCLATTALAAPETLPCGAASYLASEYVCYNNRTLCPIINSLPLSHCPPAGGCYAPQQFSCDAATGELRTLPVAAGDRAFTLTAWGTRTAYRGKEVNACGGYLAIGANARVCTGCPKGVEGVDCDKYGRQTVLRADGRMAVDVPGGQYWYIHPSDGALMYTDVLPPRTPAPVVVPGNGTAGIWPNATTTAVPEEEWVDERPQKQWSDRGGITTYENGFFVADGQPHYFKACLRTHAGGGVGTGRAWRIYATSNWVALDADCEPIKLVAAMVDAKMGAYEYH
ncbi:hypothetical protein QBC39DRAFT_379392 [Podospora conica]|nr:hypothetical protein QBC39DRAFT_379392 [Schizothecium conicum]